MLDLTPVMYVISDLLETIKMVMGMEIHVREA